MTLKTAIEVLELFIVFGLGSLIAKIYDSVRNRRQNESDYWHGEIAKLRAQVTSLEEKVTKLDDSVSAEREDRQRWQNKYYQQSELQMRTELERDMAAIRLNALLEIIREKGSAETKGLVLPLFEQLEREIEHGNHKANGSSRNL